MSAEFSIARSKYELDDNRPRFGIHETVHLNQEARLAMSLIERWGMVAAKPDGEDGAGRQKLTCLSPEEVVSKACSTVSAAMAEFRQLGWILDLPTLDQAEEALKSKENGKERRN